MGEKESLKEDCMLWEAGVGALVVNGAAGAFGWR